MWLRVDGLLDRVRDVIVDLATVLQVVFDLCCVAFVFTIVIVFLNFLFNAVSKCVQSVIIFVRILVSFVFAILFLEHDFGAKLFQKLVGLLQNLHQTTVSLSVDQVDVGIEIVVFESV